MNPLLVCPNLISYAQNADLNSTFKQRNKPC